MYKCSVTDAFGQSALRWTGADRSSKKVKSHGQLLSFDSTCRSANFTRRNTGKDPLPAVSCGNADLLCTVYRADLGSNSRRFKMCMSVSHGCPIVNFLSSLDLGVRNVDKLNAIAACSSKS